MNMRAFVLTRYGGPDAMELRDVPRPSPGPGEVLIHVYAAGLNPIDFKMRERAKTSKPDQHLRHSSGQPVGESAARRASMALPIGTSSCAQVVPICQNWLRSSISRNLR